MSAPRTGLLIALRPTLAMALIPSWPVVDLAIDGERYVPVGSEWSGFYDWLRNENGIVIGVRYHPTENTRFILDKSRDLAYTSVGQYEALSIFFAKDRAFDPTQSEHQDFAYDQVFVSMFGEGTAICFSTEDLTESQIAGLLHGQTETLVVEASH